MTAFCLLWFLVMGVFPLYLFYRGRPFLVISSGKEAIAFPMDRTPAAVNRAIALLRQMATAKDIQWDV
jgi:hypothetical protein